MAAYCFRCDGRHDASCDTTVVLNTNDPSAMNKGEPHHFVRDYRAEGVGFQVVQLQRERERGGRKAVRDMFLPTAKDFESPKDPDGTKGIQEWADTHAPREGNSKPLYPDIPKRSY